MQHTKTYRIVLGIAALAAIVVVLCFISQWREDPGVDPAIVRAAAAAQAEQPASAIDEPRPRGDARPTRLGGSR